MPVHSLLLLAALALFEMFPTFRGGDRAAAAERSDLEDGHVSSHFERMEVEDDRDANLTGWSSADARPGPQSPGGSAAPFIGSASSSSSFSSTFAESFTQHTQSLAAHAPTASQLREYMAGIASLAADAKLGAQVARVRLGLDARVRKACESPVLSQLGPTSAMLRPRELSPTPSEALEPEGLRELISSSTEAHAHLRVVLSAMEDYQRHRQGLAEAAQRLGLALQEAGQRSPGEFGEALGACGLAQQRAAAARREASGVEEVHVLSKLRAHDGKAASDCRRAVRQYEAALHELRLLRRARLEAQLSKQAASGDSMLAPRVEADAARLEEAWLERVRETGDKAEAKLRMFQAKHQSDYAFSIATHMAGIAAEEQRIAEAHAEAAGAVAVVRRSMPSH